MIEKSDTFDRCYEINKYNIGKLTKTDMLYKEIGRMVAEYKKQTISAEVSISEPNVASSTINPRAVKDKRFIVGCHYSLFPMGNKTLRREYVLKKTIHAILGDEVRIVVMKQISGDTYKKYTLNRSDCIKYHIKFEDGLEVFSMDMDWRISINK